MGKKTESKKVNSKIGIPKNDCKKIADGLSTLLADSFVLYIKTHNYHWNVEGPMFNTLHQMFMEQYTELWNALDLIAERIRSLGEYAPGSYKAFNDRANIKESSSFPSAKKMIQELLEGNEIVANTARKVFPVAEAASDEATLDLLTQRLQVHEKTAWMLRALLKDK